MSAPAVREEDASEAGQPGGAQRFVVQKWDAASGRADNGPTVGPYVPYEPYVPPSPRRGAYDVASVLEPTSGYQASEADASGSAPPPVEGAPYQVGDLEGERAPRPRWLVPALAAIAVLALFVIGFAGYFALAKTGGDEAAIRDVITKSNDAQSRAWKTLDTTELSQYWTGQVLSDNVQAVNALKQNGMYAQPIKQRLDIKDIKVDGSSAVVHTVEQWSVDFYRQSDGSKVDSRGPDALAETYYLVNQNGHWLVNKLDIQQLATALPTTQQN